MLRTMLTTLTIHSNFPKETDLLVCFHEFGFCAIDADTVNTRVEDSLAGLIAMLLDSLGRTLVVS
jgi:hypothetical protein